MHKIIASITNILLSIVEEIESFSEHATYADTPMPPITDRASPLNITPHITG